MTTVPSAEGTAEATSRTTSDKQIAANRRNAARSTGPRTSHGREVSKMNALKHGILSPQVLVRGKALKESKRAWAALHRRFWEDLQPQGPLEEMLVDQIVTAHWRLRRALTAESAEIALRVDAARRKRSRATESVLEWAALGDPIPGMEKSSIGNALLAEWLREIRAGVEAEDALTENAIEQLAGRFGGKPNSLVRSLDDFRRKLEAEPGRPEAAVRERQKTETLTFLDRAIDRCRYRQERCTEEEVSEQEARRAAAVLPSGKALDKILRYETKLERQMYRAIAQLERVQRMRRGESIPAPLTVQISDRG